MPQQRKYQQTQDGYQVGLDTGTTYRLAKDNVPSPKQNSVTSEEIQTLPLRADILKTLLVTLIIIGLMAVAYMKFR